MKSGFICVASSNQIGTSEFDHELNFCLLTEVEMRMSGQGVNHTYFRCCVGFQHG
jgi:hypothetical protein